MPNENKTQNQLNFAKKLAAVDKPSRDRGVKKLSQWLLSKKDLTELDLMKVWKALYYCFWLSDKPLIQQDLAEQLAGMFATLGQQDLSKAFLYFKTFMITMEREWHTIDIYRMDKFLMIVRKFVGQALTLLKKHNWDAKMIQNYNALVQEHPFALDASHGHIGIKLHYSDIFLEELHKIEGNECPFSLLEQLYEPFYNVLTSCKSPILLKRVIKRQFTEFITFWLPEGDEDSEEEDQFFLVDFAVLSDKLKKLASQKNTLKENRKAIYALCEEFTGMADELDKEEEDLMEVEEEKVVEIPKGKNGKKEAVIVASTTPTTKGNNTAAVVAKKAEKSVVEPQQQQQNGKKRKSEEKKEEEEERPAVAVVEKKNNNNAQKKQKAEQQPSVGQKSIQETEKKAATPKKDNKKQEVVQEVKTKETPQKEANKKKVAEEEPKSKAKQTEQPAKQAAATVVVPSTPQDKVKKSVTLNMKANIAQEYNDSLRVSTDSPLDKNKHLKPNPILKRRDTPIRVNLRSPANQSSLKKKK